MARIDRRAIAGGLLAAAIAGSAFAGGGDNGMNPFYGDSWAALEGNGVNSGGTTAMPGAATAHEDRNPHFALFGMGGLHRGEAATADAMHRNEATAETGMASMKPALSGPAPVARAPTSAPTQIDPFEDKAGS